jgi:hypothetical protein
VTLIYTPSIHLARQQFDHVPKLPQRNKKGAEIKYRGKDLANYGLDVKPKLAISSTCQATEIHTGL